MKIISGCQTGTDLGALFGAKEVGLKTGGTAPRGWYNENGCEQHLMVSFGMVEGGIYPERSMKNVDDSDGTLAILWNNKSVGTMKTIGYAMNKKWQWPRSEIKYYSHLVFLNINSNYKPIIVICNNHLNDSAFAVKQFINRYQIQTLNVCGHRESSAPGISDFASRLIIEVFK